MAKDKLQKNGSEQPSADGLETPVIRIRTSESRREEAYSSVVQPTLDVGEWYRNHGRDPTTDSASPDIVVVVFPFKNYTFIPDEAEEEIDAQTIEEALEIGEPLFLEENCIALECQSSKSQPEGSLSGVFIGEYLMDVHVGDHIFAWFCDNPVDAQTVRDKIRNREAPNDFASGLKFWGRVSSVREGLNVDAASGITTKRTSITARSFSELNVDVFFEPGLVRQDATGTKFYVDLVRAVQGLVFRQSNNPLESPRMASRLALEALGSISLATGKAYQDQYDSIILQAAATHGVDPFLIKAVIKAESNFKFDAISYKTAEDRAAKRNPIAFGLMQMIPSTATQMGVLDTFDPEQNIFGGTKYLALLLAEFGGDVDLALAGYNAGPHRVKQFGGIPPFRETQNYVPKVKNFQRAFSNGQAVDLPKADNATVPTEEKLRVIRTQEFIPGLIEAIVGHGIGDLALERIGERDVIKSANDRLLIPQQVARIFGQPVRAAAKVAPSYTDVLKKLVGGQSYKADINAISVQAQPDPQTLISRLTDSGSTLTVPEEAGVLLPSGDYSDPVNHVATAYRLAGTYTPQISPFHGTPLWSILQQYLNPAMNEMYCTIRVGPDGRLHPYFVLRQIPLTSPFLDRIVARGRSIDDPIPGTLIERTDFLNLPRWRVPSALVHSYSLGTSGAARTNFVVVRGAPLAPSVNEVALSIARSPPRTDNMDAIRNGPEIFYGQVQGELSELASPEPLRAKYTALAADRMMGGQYRLTGEVVMRGQQLPICIGDNIELAEHPDQEVDARFGNSMLQGLLCHIEQVVHRYAITPDGKKRFTTSLAVSHGVNLDGLPLGLAVAIDG